MVFMCGTTKSVEVNAIWLPLIFSCVKNWRTRISGLSINNFLKKFEKNRKFQGQNAEIHKMT